MALCYAIGCLSNSVAILPEYPAHRVSRQRIWPLAGSNPSPRTSMAVIAVRSVPCCTISPTDTRIGPATGPGRFAEGGQRIQMAMREKSGVGIVGAEFRGRSGESCADSRLSCGVYGSCPWNGCLGKNRLRDLDASRRRRAPDSLAEQGSQTYQNRPHADGGTDQDCRASHRSTSGEIDSASFAPRMSLCRR